MKTIPLSSPSHRTAHLTRRPRLRRSRQIVKSMPNLSPVPLRTTTTMFPPCLMSNRRAWQHPTSAQPTTECRLGSPTIRTSFASTAGTTRRAAVAGGETSRPPRKCASISSGSIVRPWSGWSRRTGNSRLFFLRVGCRVEMQSSEFTRNCSRRERGPLVVRSLLLVDRSPRRAMARCFPVAADWKDRSAFLGTGR